MPQPSSSPPPGGGRLIAVASGKGGVGKTWLAITLSHALALAGRRVLLVDADLGLANVDVQLGLEPGRGLADVLAGRLSAREAARRHPETGFDVLAGCSGSGALAGLDEAAHRRLLDALGEAGPRWQDVVLDLGAGLDRGVRALAAASDILLVVATEEPTSLTDAYAVLKLHRRDRPGGDARVVVNLAADRAAGERTWRCLDRACASFLGGGVPLAGVLRRDRRCRRPSAAKPRSCRGTRPARWRRTWTRSGPALAAGDARGAQAAPKPRRRAEALPPWLRRRPSRRKLVADRERPAGRPLRGRLWGTS